MWYVVQCISGREESAIEKCRNALDSKLEPKIFSPICQFQKRYEGLWHTIEQIAFPGYILIESSQPAELEKLLQRISGVVVPVRIGGGFFPMREEEEAFLREMLDPFFRWISGGWNISRIQGSSKGKGEFCKAD